jgi:hypothetical protein
MHIRPIVLFAACLSLLPFESVTGNGPTTRVDSEHFSSTLYACTIIAYIFISKDYE